MSDWFKNVLYDIGSEALKTIKEDIDDRIKEERRKQEEEKAMRRKRIKLVVVLLLAIVILMVVRMKGVFNGVF